MGLTWSEKEKEVVKDDTRVFGLSKKGVVIY